MPNRPEYMAIWLGITSVGGVVALLNTNLVGPSLAHCINIVAPKHLIVAAELVDPLTTALPDLTVSPTDLDPRRRARLVSAYRSRHRAAVGRSAE